MTSTAPLHILDDDDDDDDGFDWEAAASVVFTQTTARPSTSHFAPPPPIHKPPPFPPKPSTSRQTTLDRFIAKPAPKPQPETRDSGQDETPPRVQIDAGKAQTWLYPVNFPGRDYQFAITKTALFSNTLVALPTGLGKTLIAAVVMYNYFRWFPEGKIVFAAPSRPLVTQQIEACHNIVGIPQEWTIDMTGQISPTKRACFWKTKRVFFVTPQVLEKDIQSGACLVECLVCLVIDEAHRALGNYASSVAVRELMAAQVQLRIVALTATPGSKQQTVQQIIDNLCISTLEYRDESDPDVAPYVHNREVELIKVAMGQDAVEISNMIYDALRPYLTRLSATGALPNRDARTWSPGELLTCRDKFRTASPPDIPQFKLAEIEGWYGVLLTGYHILKLLSAHGVRPAHELLEEKLKQGWCSSTVDDSSIDDYYSFMMASGSVRILDPSEPPPSKRSRKERTRGKSSGTTDTTEPMEQHIWKDFPEDLYEAVIARLPIATFFHFRSVCRKWNSLLDSESFSQRCTEIPQANPWFYTITHENVNSGAMYDPSLKKWHHPTISSLPTKLIVLPVASAGGLVCFLDIGNRNFYVCNPLNQSFKELPARSVKVWSRIAVGMTLNGSSTSGGYKVMWVGCDGEYEVYDSLRNSWTRPGSMPSSVKLPLSLNFRSQAVTIDSTLYFMRSRPDGIVSYDMVTGVWKQFIIPTPLHLTDHTLAECGGRIMLVGLLSKNAATCVCIWELQKMTLLWKEVDRMPNIWCLEFYGKHVRMTCLGNKGLLMLSLRSRQINRLVTYNVSSKEWLKVPGCVVPHGRKRQWIACGTSFYPCLTAVA